jgi:hypothetical protein
MITLGAGTTDPTGQGSINSRLLKEGVGAGGPGLGARRPVPPTFRVAAQGDLLHNGRTGQERSSRAGFALGLAIGSPRSSPRARRPALVGREDGAHRAHGGGVGGVLRGPGRTRGAVLPVAGTFARVPLAAHAAAEAGPAGETVALSSGVVAIAVTSGSALRAGWHHGGPGASAERAPQATRRGASRSCRRSGPAPRDRLRAP